MKLKILQINKFHFEKGGSERYYFAVSDLLRKQGYEVIHFSMRSDNNKPSRYAKYFVDYIDLHKFNIKNIIKFFYNYDAVKRLKKLIKNEKPDIAHLHNIAHQLTPAIIKVLKKNNIKIVQTLHDYKLICPNAKLYTKNKDCQKCLGGKYYNCFLNSCVHGSRAKSFLAMMEAYLNNKILKYYNDIDLFIAPSKFMKDVSVKFGVPADKIEVLYNFLSDEWLKSIKLESNNKLSDNYFLYFGRLSEEKGVDTVLQALKKVKSKNIKFFIAGSGPDQENIKKVISKLNLDNRVKLLGFKTGEELNNLIVNARFVVMPSLWPENMPYSLLESLAMNKIVIATKVGGMTEVIHDKENGYLYPAGNADKLANKIDIASSLDKESLQKILQNIKKTVTLFKSEKYYVDLDVVYRNI